MKRIVAVLAALVLAVFTLAACSDSDGESTDHADMSATSMAMPRTPTTSVPISGMPMSMPSANNSSANNSSVNSSSMGIVISGFEYSTPDAVMPGQILTIQNNDTVEHSVTSDTAGLFSEDIEPGETETVTVPMDPGSYAFHCTYHPSMHGTLTVK